MRVESLDDVRIRGKGWVRMLARVTDDSDAPFVPSIYGIEPLKVLEGGNLDGVRRVVSFVEEFRLQVRRDELVLVEGNVEHVVGSGGGFDQVILSCCPRYYEQVLKVAELP